MTEPRRYATRLPREVRREQVLDAALRLIGREGFAAATIAHVAGEAEIAKPVVYSLFETQEGMQHALMVREHDRAFAVAASALAAGAVAPDPVAALAAGLNTFLDEVAAAPDTWRLVFLPPVGMPPSVREAILDGRERWRRELEPIVTDRLGAVGVGGVDAELCAHLIRGNAEYLARLVLEEPDRFSAERIRDFVATVVDRVPALREVRGEGAR